MSPLEKMRKDMELKKIDAAIAELEYKIQERLEDIDRMREHINLQLKRKKELGGEQNG